MGMPKGLMSYRGKPWFLSQIERFERAGGRSVFLVLGFDKNRYFNEVSWLEKAEKAPVSFRNLKVSVVVNPEPKDGQFSSFLAGARCVIRSEAVDGVYLSPIDVPVPSRDTFRRLALSKRVDVSIPLFREQGGHPIAISLSWVKKWGKIDARKNRLDFLINALSPDRVNRVFVEEEVTRNLNTPETFQAWENGEFRRLQ